MTQEQKNDIHERALYSTNIDSSSAEWALDDEKLGPYNYGIHLVGSFYRKEDAQLMAHARNDILDLLTEVKRLQSIVAGVGK